MFEIQNHWKISCREFTASINLWIWGLYLILISMIFSMCRHILLTLGTNFDLFSTFIQFDINFYSLFLTGFHCTEWTIEGPWGPNKPRKCPWILTKEGSTTWLKALNSQRATWLIQYHSAEWLHTGFICWYCYFPWLYLIGWNHDDFDSYS